LNLIVLYEKEIRLTWVDSHTYDTNLLQAWWNGMYVYYKNHNELYYNDQKENTYRFINFICYYNKLFYYNIVLPQALLHIRQFEFVYRHNRDSIFFGKNSFI
jgi:hypothetical protein